MFGHIEELRAILLEENEDGIKRFKDLDWKLTLVTACRARQKILVPKYTLKVDLKEGETTDSFVLDSDYANLKRIQGELEDALRSIDATYSKKVFKFLK